MQENTEITPNEFSLKDKNNVKKLEDILDDLLLKMDDKREFKMIYQNLPILIYNKIDSLRHISLERKSEDFKRIANKAKIVSKEFHNFFK